MAVGPTIDRPLVMFIYGTRPEAIKMAPLVQLTAQSARLAAYVVVTGQHRSMLDQVNEAFAIHPDADLDIVEDSGDFAAFAAQTLVALTALMRQVRPATIVVHGGTSTAFASAQAAFYLGVPVVHLEAGLRTHDLRSPFPEEANRQLISRLAALHLAPTGDNRANLTSEDVDPDVIVVTGNTVIDALQQTAARVAVGDSAVEPRRSARRDDEPQRGTGGSNGGQSRRRRRILVTMHRHENLGETMSGIAQALARVAQTHADVDLIIPLHLDPAIRSAVVPVLRPLPNVTITDPLSYTDFVAELTRCDLIVSDSGGLQEEGPGLGKPVLVLRTSTERPEAIETGTVRLIGTEEAEVVTAVNEVLDDPAVYERMATSVNPYGDGLASPRCLAAIEQLLGVGQREPDFVAHEGSLTRRLRHLTGLPRAATRSKRASSA